LGKDILGFIKNYQRNMIYCSLNIGISGLVKDAESFRTMSKLYSFGDIVVLKVVGFENKN